MTDNRNYPEPTVSWRRRALRSPAWLTVAVGAVILLGAVWTGADHLTAAIALAATVRFVFRLGIVRLGLVTAAVLTLGALHPALQALAILFAVAVLIRLAYVLIMAGVHQLAAAARSLAVTTRRVVKLLLILSASAMRSGKITRYVLAVVGLAYVYPFLTYALLHGFGALAELGLGWGAVIGQRLVPESSSTPSPLFDPVAILHRAIAVADFVFGYAVPCIALAMGASAALASVGIAKKRLRSERSLVAMFVELLLLYAVLIHYMNIVFSEGYHYKNVAWPGQDLCAWVEHPALYIKSALDSLFVSAASLTLLGITAVDLNSYAAKALYVGQALHGLYLLVLGIRRLPDVER